MNVRKIPYKIIKKKNKDKIQYIINYGFLKGNKKERLYSEQQDYIAFSNINRDIILAH